MMEDLYEGSTVLSPDPLITVPANGHVAFVSTRAFPGTPTAA